MATIESQGMLTKGVQLLVKQAEEFIVLEDLQSVPDLGGDTENVEVTTLANGAKRYIKGLKDYGTLDFGFLYGNGESSSYKVLSDLAKESEAATFKVSLPDETGFEFEAETSVKIDAMDVGSPITFTASLALNSEMRNAK